MNAFGVFALAFWIFGMIVVIVQLYLTRPNRTRPEPRPDAGKMMILGPPPTYEYRADLNPLPVPHPTDIVSQWFGVDGTAVIVTSRDGTVTRHAVLTPAMREVVRRMAAIQEGAPTPAPPRPLTLPEMWDLLGHPELAARERELIRLAEEEASVKRSLGET